MLEEEDKAHALEKQKIQDDAKRMRDDTTRSSKDRDEHADAARARYQREEKRHQEAVKRIHEMNKAPTKKA